MPAFGESVAGSSGTVSVTVTIGAGDSPPSIELGRPPSATVADPVSPQRGPQPAVARDPSPGHPNLSFTGAPVAAELDAALLLVVAGATVLTALKRLTR
jgi:hypothetical protein